MSSPSTTASDALPGASTPSVATLLKPLEAVGFWTAVALPFLYVPLLATGVQSQASRLAALLLVATHAVALVVGHRHNAGD